MTIPAINMNPRYGFFEVTSTPSGAEVLLNNSLVGRTPLPKTQISSEYHEMTLRYPMYHDHQETFTIEDGDHKRFDVALKPAFGGLLIASEPSGARVFIASSEVGTTPYENMQQPSGRRPLHQWDFLPPWHERQLVVLYRVLILGRLVPGYEPTLGQCAPLRQQ